MSWTYLLLAASVHLLSAHKVKGDNFSPKKIDFGGGLTAMLVRTVKTVGGDYRARLDLFCYDIRYWNFGLEAEYSSSGRFTGRFWPQTFSFPNCDFTVEKKLKESKIDRKRLKELEDSYLQFVGLKKNTAVKVVERVELVLKVINGTSEPVVHADVTYQSEVHVVRGVIQFFALTGKTVFVSNQLALAKTKTFSRRRRRLDSVAWSEEDIRGRHNTMCARGTGGNPLTGYFNYGSSPNDTCLPVTARGNKCSLYIDGVGQVRSGFGWPNGCLDSPPISFPCDTGLNGPASVGLDALRGIYIATNALRDLQVSVPASCEVDVCVNFGHSLGNAMWTSKSILVGDGVPGRSYPFVTMDVMCHEYGHCLTAAWSGLLIKDQSGGMNDAFSDALSQVCKEVTGRTTWTVGEGVFYDGNGSHPHRYFQDPTLDGSSIGNAADFTRGMNSHMSCGVYNRFFYCLSVDQGLGPLKSFLLLAVANQIRWHPETNFEEGACAVCRSAVDLGYNVTSVTQCFNRVGLLKVQDACPLDNLARLER